MLTLDTNITKISRVGLTTAKKLKRLGVATIEDLLFYFPFRYDDFRTITKIADLKAGDSATIVGQIEIIRNKKSFRKRMYITEAIISDQSDQIKVIWFNQPFIAKNLKVGDMVSLAGKVEDEYGNFTMASPIYEKVTSPEVIHTQGLVPNYHLTANVTQKQIRFLIKQVFGLVDKITDWLPEKIIKKNKLLTLKSAISKIHFPKNFKEIEEAKKRLAFNELFLIQLQSLILKKELLKNKAIPIIFKEIETKNFVQSLPFKLTDSQRKASWEILQDIAKNKPMARLLEGDVGSGKTLVAVIAMLNVSLNNYQSVLMVPTEILAHQHYENIKNLLKNFNLNIGLITRSHKKISSDGEKNDSQFILDKAQIIIGTHVLIQEKINFNNLALAIIDEQHRFGVEQRKLLTEKSNNSKLIPHLLSMTATPIPRSLALALYGDLELSIINQMPQGRKKILTKIVSELKRNEAYNFIRKEIYNGRQVFVICPLIDFSDKLGVKSVKEEYEKLDKHIFKDIPIGMLHGKLKQKEKEEVMENFLAKKIKILVSTSVVEVGVDVPNATIMMIEGAERFGLAQLHQFRGRVGRSEHQSYCLLFTESRAIRTIERLNSLINCHDGFALAKMDLKFRGPGEVFGLEQKGFPELKIATLFDYELMKLAREEANLIVKDDNELNQCFGIKAKLKLLNSIIHLE